MKVLVILGPTGIGKTKMSIELAKRLNGEIINADSTQVYKGLDIATAKVQDDERDGIKHHLFSFVDLENDYSVYDYQRDCRLKIEEVLTRKKMPILVGGTGLYIKAALYDYQLGDESEDRFVSYTNNEIYNELKRYDPECSIHLNNRPRLIRALNYCLKYHKPFSKKEKTSKLLYDAIFIGLTIDRDILYQRINKRVDLMIDAGLIDEAYDLYQRNIRTKAVLTPIGYRQLFLYFDKLIDKDEAICLIKKASRNYAKRQYTWFNNQLVVKWFDVSDFSDSINAILKFIKNKK